MYKMLKYSMHPILFAGLISLLGRNVEAFPTIGTTEFIQTWTEIDVTELPVYASDSEVVVAAETEAITTKERVVEEILDSLPETTTLRSVTEIPEEFTTQEMSQIQIHPDKEDIINELQNIWYYTEGLDDDQNELKSSLSSLVHMTYARVYEQPDETLSRLKYLLRKLRTRLVDDVEPTTTQNPSENNTNENPVAMRKKRSPYEFGNDIIFEEINPDDNLLYPNYPIGEASPVLINNIKDLPVPEINKTSSPSDTTIQKVIHVGDRFVPVTLTESPKPASTESINNPYKTHTSPPKYAFNKTHDLIKDHQTGSFHYQTNNKTSTTVDDIIQSIITVLREPLVTKTKPSPATPSTLISLFEIKTKPALISNNSILLSSENENNPSSSAELPSYLNKLAMGSHVIISNNNVNKITNVAEENEIMDLDGVMTTTELSIVVNSVSELTNSNTNNENDMPSSPTKVLNGTMETLMVVVNTFSNLPNATRLVLYFSVLVSIVSIALGLYSLGPPIVVVGVLGVILPVIFLILFQSNRGKRKNLKEEILNNFSVEDVNKILDLISDAFARYQ